MKQLKLDESNVKAKGPVSPKSLLTDTHIQKVLDYLVKETGVKKQAIVDDIDKAIKDIEDMRGKSSILYDAIADNIIEQNLYKQYREHKVGVPKGCAVFDPVTFNALVRRIKVENPSLFPLRNFIDKKPLASPRIILVPSKDKADEKWNKIETAAATPTGEFIFNTECMQRDMNFAFVQGVKPKSKKYKSNGGEFPDEWAPVEFTVLHEFYHYTHGDFHYGKVLGGNPTIHNWAGDFRSNYDLIKAGHVPYAEGLFSDYINYDKHPTYQSMYEMVKKEFEKLSPPQQKQMEKIMGGLGDDHEPHAGEKQPQLIPADASPGELEEHSKKTSGKAGKEPGEGKPGEGEKSGQGPSGKGPGGRAQGSSTPTAIDYGSIKPRFNWKDLINKLVKSSDTLEVTYQKIHRRNITSVHLATQVGAAVVRPGEKVVPSNLAKLCLVIDSSGSMHEAIKTVFANVTKLFNETGNGVSRTFVIAEFSNDYHLYSCTLSGKTGSAIEIKGPEGVKAGGSGARMDLSSLMNRHQGGGTNFSDELAKKLGEFAAEKYNILILTDSDIAAAGNMEAFLNLYNSHRDRVYLILDSRATFTSMVQKMKHASANITHL